MVFLLFEEGTTNRSHTYMTINLLLKICSIRSKGGARHGWLTPVILATQEAEIRRLLASPGQIVLDLA
jgi:hypothetical protein